MSERLVIEPEIIRVPESETVFRTLTEVRPSLGQRPAERIIRSALFENPLTVFSGPPGNGKTTSLEQARNAIEKEALRLGIEVEFVLRFYDNYLADFESENGPRDQFGPIDWLVFNNLMSDDILRLKKEAIERKAQEEAARMIILAEIPGVGSIKQRNVGVSTMKSLMKEAQENGGSMFLYFVNNPILEHYSGLLRKKIAMTPDEKVVDALEGHNLVVKNVDDKLQVGKRIKRANAKSAKQEHMERIEKEIRTEIADWAQYLIQERYAEALSIDPNASADPNSYDPRKLERSTIKYPRQVTASNIRKIYESFGESPPAAFQRRKTYDLLEDFSDEAIYILHMFNDYGLSNKNALALCNTFQSGILHVDPGIADLEKGSDGYAG